MSEPALKLLTPDIDPDSGEVLERAACTECADLRGKLLNKEQDLRLLEKDMRDLRAENKRLTEDREEKLRKHKLYPVALGLFEEWTRECGHEGAVFDPRRIQLALAAVRRYPEGKKDVKIGIDKRVLLSWVIQAGKHLAYVDEKGERHDGFGLLFRDSEHVEKYVRKWALHLKRTGQWPAIMEKARAGEGTE
jgi:hypothetical protein